MQTGKNLTKSSFGGTEGQREFSQAHERAFLRAEVSKVVNVLDSKYSNKKNVLCKVRNPKFGNIELQCCWICASLSKDLGERQ